MAEGNNKLSFKLMEAFCENKTSKLLFSGVPLINIFVTFYRWL